MEQFPPVSTHGRVPVVDTPVLVYDSFIAGLPARLSDRRLINGKKYRFYFHQRRAGKNARRISLASERLVSYFMAASHRRAPKDRLGRFSSDSLSPRGSSMGSKDHAIERDDAEVNQEKDKARSFHCRLTPYLRARERPMPKKKPAAM